MLTFPYWNSAAPSGSTYYHMISTSSPTCTGVTTLLVFLACTYSNDANKELTVTNLLGSDAAAGTTITFTVNSFTNPYSTAPKSGFVVSTYSSTGCIID